MTEVQTDKDGKPIRCEHCGSYEGPFVYRRELGAWYCVGHGSMTSDASGPAYTPVEKPYRVVKCAPDGFILSIEDSDVPSASGINLPDQDIYVDCWSQSTLLESESRYKKKF